VKCHAAELAELGAQLTELVAELVDELVGVCISSFSEEQSKLICVMNKFIL